MSEGPVAFAGPPDRPLDEETFTRYWAMSGEAARAEWHRVMEDALRNAGPPDVLVPTKLRVLIDVCQARGVGIVQR